MSALVLAAAGLTHLRARRREARYEAAFPPVGRMLTVEGTRLHVWQAGRGPDLVLIHGASANLREFAMGLGPRLARHFRVTAFDRPGMGWSDDIGAEAPADQARAIAAAATALGLRDPLVLGHSYGGAVAMAWALQGGVAGVALVSAVSMPWPGKLAPWYRITASPLGRGLVVPLIAAWLPRARLMQSVAEVFAPQPCPPGYAKAAAVPLTLRRRTLATNARQVNRLLSQIRTMAPRYDTIRIPVEILHGDCDTTVSHAIHALPVSQVLPGAALTLLPGVGHMPHQTHPEAVEAAVMRLAARAGLRLD